MAFFENIRAEELSDLAAAYGAYIGKATAHHLFETGWTPAPMEQFYENEYKSIWKDKHDFEDYFSEAADMMAKSNSAFSLATAIDDFYYEHDPYEYKDQIDDREQAVADIETDILNGEIDYLIEHLQNDMAEYGQTDSLHLAAELIIAQLRQYQAEIQKEGQEQGHETNVQTKEEIQESPAEVSSVENLSELYNKVVTVCNYIVEQAARKSTSGNYIVDHADVSHLISKFDFGRYFNTIACELESRAEVLDLDADFFDGRFNFVIDPEYCKNYEPSSVEVKAGAVYGFKEVEQRPLLPELLSDPNSRLVIQTDRPDRVMIGCYADQVLPHTDRADLLDSYFGAYFIVPKDWAEKQVRENTNYKDLEEFFDDYTWDTTDGWYDKAFFDGVLLGVELGETLYEEKEIPKFREQTTQVKEPEKSNDLTHLTDLSYDELLEHNDTDQFRMFSRNATDAELLAAGFSEEEYQKMELLRRNFISCTVNPAFVEGKAAAVVLGKYTEFAASRLFPRGHWSCISAITDVQAEFMKRLPELQGLNISVGHRSFHDDNEIAVLLPLDMSLDKLVDLSEIIDCRMYTFDGTVQGWASDYNIEAIREEIKEMIRENANDGCYTKDMERQLLLCADEISDKVYGALYVYAQENLDGDPSRLDFAIEHDIFDQVISDTAKDLDRYIDLCLGKSPNPETCAILKGDILEAMRETAWPVGSVSRFLSSYTPSDAALIKETVRGWSMTLEQKLSKAKEVADSRQIRQIDSHEPERD